MSKPTPLSGFPELLPAERNAELAVIESLRTVFELHGFANIETRVVEPLDRLLRKGEIDKEVYVLRRLQADDEASTPGVGLHFDLTVPFARYVLENAGKLEFPFRRYQIQKAWRGERPQEGRFREFTQADIDVVMRDELPFHFDVEVARVMAEALSAAPAAATDVAGEQPQVDRGLLPRHRRARPGAVITDRRQARQTVASTTIEAHADDDGGLTPTGRAMPRARRHRRRGRVVRRSGAGARRRARAARPGARRARGGHRRLRASQQRPFRVVASLSLARGLDYYTGTVFEIYMAGLRVSRGPSAGEAATTRSHRTARRPIQESASRSASREACALVEPRVADLDTRGAVCRARRAWSTRSSRDASDAIAQQFRARGIATEVARPHRSTVEQIRYAERRGIPFVWFPGVGRRVRTRSRTSAAATRSPPTRTAGNRPTRTCVRRVITQGAEHVIRTHDAGSLRADPRRTAGHAGRLGGTPPRPRGRGVHRPARRKRRRAGRHPGRGGRTPAAFGVLRARRRRGSRRPGAMPIPTCPPARSRSSSPSSRSSARRRRCRSRSRSTTRPRSAKRSAQVSLSRPAPAGDGGQHPAARGRDTHHSRASPALPAATT